MEINHINSAYILGNLADACANAAIEAHKLLGRGEEKAADQAAVEAMRRSLNLSAIDGTIVIGEGERDKAPMLYIGEKVGTKIGPKIDIAVDPLEGTTILANAGFGSLAVIAACNEHQMLHAPDTYMEKIAIGFDCPEQIIDLDLSIQENLGSLARAANKDINELLVIVLNRTRHEEIIAKIRAAGAKVKLLSDGDIAAIIQTTRLGEADMYIGVGGAPEGVLAAAALQTLGGQMCARLVIKSDIEKERAQKIGISDFTKKYYLNDLAPKNTLFAAVGVTDGDLLKGVRYRDCAININSLLINGYPQSFSFVNDYKIQK